MDTCLVPVTDFWYVNQIYKEEIQHIEKRNGVKISAVVNVTFEADETDGGPQKALSEFINLVQKCTGESDSSVFPLKYLNQDELKDTLKIIQRKENKLLLTLSSEEMVVCGPRQSPDAISETLNAMQKTKIHTCAGESPQTSQSTSVDIGMNMEVEPPSAWDKSAEKKDEVQVTLSVMWSEGVQPQKGKIELEKALQTWVNKTRCHGECRVVSVSEDGRAVIRIKPAPVFFLSQLQELTGQTLTRKYDRTVTITSVSLTALEPETQIPDKASVNFPPSFLSEPQHEKVQQSHFSSSAAVSTSAEEMCTCLVPIGLFWYVYHIYKEEIQHIEKKNGVMISAEVNVTFEADQKDGGPQEALSEFINLVQKCIGESDSTVFPLKYLDQEELKDTLKIIQRKENKLLLALSSEEMIVCGPRQSQDAISKTLNAMQKTKTHTSPGESPHASQSTSLDTGMNMEVKKDEVQVTISVSVMWSEGVQPQKCKMELERALQTWSNKNKCDQDCKVLSVSEDGMAVIRIKPAPAVSELQELIGQALTRKTEKTVTITSVSLTALEPETQIPDNASTNLPP